MARKKGASIGVRTLYLSPIVSQPTGALPVYGAGKPVAKLASFGGSPEMSEAEFYAGDTLEESAEEFNSSEITVTSAYFDLMTFAEIYGLKYEDGKVTSNINDTAPYFGLGGIQVISSESKMYYRAYIYPKVKPLRQSWTQTTKGSSTTFNPQNFAAKAMAADNGDWEIMQEFETEAQAQAFIETTLNISGTWRTVKIVSTGDGAVTPSNYVYVADGTSFVLTITGAPTALYKNGVDDVSAIAAGKYTIASVTADTELAVIFPTA